MEQKQERSFVTETIKDKPVNTKKLFRRTVTTVVLAVVFGLIACLTILLIEPVINKILNPEEITKVEFPEEEQEVKPEELLTEESVAQREESLQEVVEAAKEVVEKGQTNVTSIEIYEQVYADFQALAKKCEKSIATVVGISEQQDWFQGTTENQNMTSGLIVAENGVEVLILADANNVQNAHEYHVRFHDKRMVEAQLKEKDEQTGLAIFAVRLFDMEETTRDSVVIAELGNSTSERIVGSPIIGIGSPYGMTDSVAYGTIVSKSPKINMADAVYNMLITDVALPENASGALINLKGEVLGFITQTTNAEVSGQTQAAIGISDIKTLIAKLSNGEKRAYIGIKGMDVTDDAHEETGVPYGVYVSEVVTGSPAMNAGILNGDVIVNIGNHSVTSFREYRAGVLALQPQAMVEVTLLRFDGTEYKEIKLEITTGEE